MELTNFNEWADNLKCPLCLNFLYKASALGCSHTFCSECIKTCRNVYIKDLEFWQEGIPDSPCPVCRTKFSDNDIKPIPTLDRMIKNLNFKCNDCESLVTFDEFKYETHQCEGLEQCKNDKCNKFIHKDKMLQHSKRCPFLILICHICKEPFYNGDFRIHLPYCFRRYPNLKIAKVFGDKS